MTTDHTSLIKMPDEMWQSYCAAVQDADPLGQYLGGLFWYAAVIPGHAVKTLFLSRAGAPVDELAAALLVADATIAAAQSVRELLINGIEELKSAAS